MAASLARTFLSSLLLALLFWQWRPMTHEMWSLESAAGSLALQAVFWLGGLLVLLSTFAIDHFHLFRLRQVYLYLRRERRHDGRHADRDPTQGARSAGLPR